MTKQDALKLTLNQTVYFIDTSDSQTGVISKGGVTLLELIGNGVGIEVDSMYGDDLTHDDVWLTEPEALAGLKRHLDNMKKDLEFKQASIDAQNMNIQVRLHDIERLTRQGEA